MKTDLALVRRTLRQVSPIKSRTSRDRRHGFFRGRCRSAGPAGRGSMARSRACGSARSCAQPCSSHSWMAPACCSTFIAHPWSVRIACGLFFVVSVEITPAEDKSFRPPARSWRLARVRDTEIREAAGSSTCSMGCAEPYVADARVFLLTGRDDLQRAVRKRSLLQENANFLDRLLWLNA